MVMGRQLFLAFLVFSVLLFAMIARSYIFDCVLSDKKWSFKTHWKSAVILSFLLALAFFVYLRITGQIWL